MASEDLIVWDGETEEYDYRVDDWKFGWSKRRVWAMRQVFRCRPQHVFVETHRYHEYELMPTIYARINTGNGTRTGWQSTMYAPSGIEETNANAYFPSWIANKLYVKADDPETDLEKFLWSSQEFKREEHLQAKNIIYYLVIYNSVYEMLYGSEPLPLQIYIGKAANGVIRRWINDQWAHCRAARDLLNSRKDCRDFPDFVAECKPAKLVDCYLAMTHLCRFQMALFVIQQCDNKVVMEDMEAELILNHGATNMHHGLNCKKSEQKTAKVSTKPMAAKVTSATTTMNE